MAWGKVLLNILNQIYSWPHLVYVYVPCQYWCPQLFIWFPRELMKWSSKFKCFLSYLRLFRGVGQTPVSVSVFETKCFLSSRGCSIPVNSLNIVFFLFRSLNLLGFVFDILTTDIFVDSKSTLSWDWIDDIVGLGLQSDVDRFKATWTGDWIFPQNPLNSASRHSRFAWELCQVFNCG